MVVIAVIVVVLGVMLWRQSRDDSGKGAKKQKEVVVGGERIENPERADSEEEESRAPEEEATVGEGTTGQTPESSQPRSGTSQPAPSPQPSSPPAPPADTTPPSAPSDIKVTDDQNGSSLTIWWNNPQDSDFAFVRIYRSDQEGHTGALARDNVKGSSLVDGNLSEGVTYHYTVRSVDTNSNESINVDQHSQTPTDFPTRHVPLPIIR